MTDLPPGWTWATVGELADVQLGRQRSPEHHRGPNMRPYLRAANITWDGLDLTDVKSMNFDEADAERFALRPGDILLNEGSGSASEVGKPALWNGEIDGCCFQNTLLRVRPHAVDVRYLYWYFYFSARTGAFGARGRGVGIRHLGKRGLVAFAVPVAPLDEQRRLVAQLESMLSVLDAALASLSRVLEQLVVARGALIDRMFCDVPNWGTLGDFAEVQGGIQKQPQRRPRDNSAPYLRVANVLRGHLDLRDVHRVELFEGELSKYRLAPGDLLIVEGNGSASQIGRSALWHGEIDDCVHQNHIIRARPRNPEDARFLNWYWNAPETSRRLASVASSSSGLYTLTAAKVRDFPVPKLTPSERQRIAGSLDARVPVLDRVAADVRAAVTRATMIRQALLQAAFNGLLQSRSSAAADRSMAADPSPARPLSPPRGRAT